jgi:hypothetical protein
MKLRSGEADTASDFYELRKENEYLKAQLDALKTEGFSVIKTHIEAVIKE